MVVLVYKGNEKVGRLGYALQKAVYMNCVCNLHSQIRMLFLFSFFSSSCLLRIMPCVDFFFPLYSVR